MRKLIPGILFCLIALSELQAQIVHICDDGAEWPPYAFWERKGNQVNKNVVTGATVELTREIFKVLGLNFTYELIPWKRCLDYVDKFDVRKKYEMFANGSHNAERAQKYHITDPIYVVHQGIFYSKKKFPKGPPIKKASDLNNYKLCGITGYNYDMFFSAGVKKQLDLGSRNDLSALKKTALDRCRFFLASVEPIYGAQAIGKFKVPSGIASMSIPGIEPTKFYLFVAKTSPRGKKLLNQINKAIKQLKNNGKAEKIYKKYLPSGSGL